MKIILACDHAGFEMKEQIKKFLTSKEYEVEDVGAFACEENDDYPDYIADAAKRVSEDVQNTRAIIFGGSGQGEAMVANRFPHVRAVVYIGEPFQKESISREVLTLTRTHNDANVLSLGARFIEKESVEEIVEQWLVTPFPGDERHVRRIEKIETVTRKDV